MQEIHKKDVTHTAKRQGSALGIALVVCILYVLGWQIFGTLPEENYSEYFGGMYHDLTDALPETD